MKLKLLHKSLLAGFLVAVSGYSMQASALPLEPFSFHQSTGFLVDSTLVPTPGGNIGWYQYGSLPAPPAGEYNTIAWGSPVGSGGLLASDPFTAVPIGDPALDMSGLRVTGYSGTLTTGAASGGGSLWGAWQSISTVYHQNRDILLANGTLAAAVIGSALTFDHSSVDFYTNVDNLPITFSETPNSDGCPLGNPNGTICDDLFHFNPGNFAPVSFTYGGETYEVQFQLANFQSTVTNYPACPGGTCTIWTAENVTSSVDVQAQIRQVPEPATLGLLGLGLLGLGLAKRRRLNG